MSGLGDPIAGSAGTGLQFGGENYGTLSSLSRLVSGSMTFEAWVRLDNAADGAYKSICSRYVAAVDAVPDLPLVRHTNRFAGIYSFRYLFHP